MRGLVLSEPMLPEFMLPGMVVELLLGEVVVLLLEPELESVVVEPLVPGEVVVAPVAPGVVDVLPGDVVVEELVLPGEVVDEPLVLLPGDVVDELPVLPVEPLVLPGVVDDGALAVESALGGAPARPAPGPVPGLVGAWAVAIPPSARRAAEVAATAAASLNLVMVSIS